jgi:hypothetical protein
VSCTRDRTLFHISLAVIVIVTVVAHMEGPD